jgi:DNA-binding PadR family transcriptional regulator
VAATAVPPSRRSSPTLSLADHVCLALVAEGPTHGWALVKLLATDGELGRIWTLSRPLTYRSLDTLVEQRLAARTESGRRAILSATPAGRRVRRRWLDTPVEHLRDVRTELLLKLALRERSGLGREPLVTRQLAELEPAIAALTTQPDGDPVDLWRSESARAVLRFLGRLREQDGSRTGRP